MKEVKARVTVELTIHMQNESELNFGGFNNKNREKVKGRVGDLVYLGLDEMEFNFLDDNEEFDLWMIVHELEVKKVKVHSIEK